MKTDRRDARRLAHFLRSGDLTAVWVPDEQTEALRDLERSRDDAKNAERVARHQLDKFLLRNERVYHDGRSWTQKHSVWLKPQKFDDPCQQCVMDDYVKTVEDATERVKRLSKEIKRFVKQTTLAPLVRSLKSFRGINTLSAVVIAAEIGDLRRFPAEPDSVSPDAGSLPKNYRMARKTILAKNNLNPERLRPLSRRRHELQEDAPAGVFGHPRNFARDARC